MSDPYKQFFKKAQETAKQNQRQPAVQSSRKKKAPTIPWRAVIGMAASLVLGLGYLMAPEWFEGAFARIEISALGSAQAEKSSPPPPKAAETAASEAKTKGEHKTEAPLPVAGDVSHFSKLKQRKEELDLREKELGELEEELQRQKVELDKRLTQLEEMRKEIAKTLKDRVDVDQEKVNKLVDLYSTMKPKQAAEVIGSLNEELAVEVLAKMKKKNAAEVMNLLPPDKARVLSEKYTGYRRNHAEPKG